MNKMYGFAAFALAAYVGALVGGYYLGKNHGVKEGLDNFHEACYTGGVVINEHTGKVIQCAPLGQVPKEELPKFFQQGVDKSSKVVYIIYL